MGHGRLLQVQQLRHDAGLFGVRVTAFADRGSGRLDELHGDGGCLGRLQRHRELERERASHGSHRYLQPDLDQRRGGQQHPECHDQCGHADRKLHADDHRHQRQPDPLYARHSGCECGEFAEFLHLGFSVFADRGAGQLDELQCDGNCIRRLYRHRQSERERASDGRQRRVQSDFDQRRRGQQHPERHHQRKHAGGKLHAHRDRNQHQSEPDPLDDGHSGCDLVGGYAGILDLGLSVFTDRGARQQHDLHSDRDSAQRLQRNGYLPGSRVAVQFERQLQSGFGDGPGNIHADREHELVDIHRDLQFEDQRNQRRRDP